MSKYLTYEERLEIQKGLKDQLSFGKIAEKIGKDRTTVAKEIKKYSYEQKTGCSGYPYNTCVHRKICMKKNICNYRKIWNFNYKKGKLVYKENL